MRCRAAKAAIPLVLALLSLTAPSASAAASQRRIAGNDRYATAAAVALDRWHHPSDVFLARGDDPADALAAAYGSGLHSSPVFLTTRDVLPTSTRDALQTMAPRLVHVLGGASAVSDTVVGDLQSMGFNVVRHAGADRYGSAAAVAMSEDATIIGQWKEEGRTALLANGNRPFDALAAGPLAAGQLYPVLLTAQDVLPAPTRDALDHLGIRHVIVLGGTDAVGDGVLAALQASGRTVRRVAGADRMETAVAVAGLLEELDIHPTRASVVSATQVADALGAGPWGAPDTPVLLCQTQASCGSATTTYAAQHDLSEVVAVGGTAAVSDAALFQVALA